MQLPSPSLPKAIWVPYWLQPVLALNSLDTTALLDLDTLSRYLSHEDIQIFLAVNNLVSDVTPNFYARDVPKLYKDDCIERLTLANDADISDTTYRIQHHDPEVFLIYVEPGFMNTLRIRARALAFVSECLKVQYSLIHMSHVSQGLLFQKYLNLLNPKVPFLKF